MPPWQRAYGKGGTWLYSSRLSQEGVSWECGEKSEPFVISIFMPNVREEHLQETRLSADMFTVWIGRSCVKSEQTEGKVGQCPFFF